MMTSDVWVVALRHVAVAALHVIHHGYRGVAVVARAGAQAGARLPRIHFTGVREVGEGALRCAIWCPRVQVFIMLSGCMGFY